MCYWLRSRVASPRPAPARPPPAVQRTAEIRTENISRPAPPALPYEPPLGLLQTFFLTLKIKRPLLLHEFGLKENILRGVLNITAGGDKNAHIPLRIM